MKSIVLFCSLFLLASCYYHPPPKFVTSHGLGVYCDQEVCFTQEEVEIMTDDVIDALVEKIPEHYSHARINELLEASREWHEIHILKNQKGEPGSCAREGDPDRVCQGFPCSASSTGWCAGLFSPRGPRGATWAKITIAVLNEDCITLNALTHELIHFFAWLVRGDTSAPHTDNDLWGYKCDEEFSSEEEVKECARTSVMRASRWASCEKLCGDLCK